MKEEMMKALRWGMGVAVIGLGGTAVVWRTVPEASSQQPSFVQPAVDHFTTFRTWTFTNPWGVYRVDAERMAFAADVESKPEKMYYRENPDGSFTMGSPGTARHYRISWDGTALYWSGLSGPLPQVYADRVAEVWAEMRAGFSSTTLVAGDPSEIDPEWREHTLGEGRTYYRVETPWSWDDHLRIYAGFRSHGHLSDLSIYDPETGAPIEVLNHPLDQVGIATPALTDVPLDPDVLSPDLPRPWNKHFPRGNATGPHGGRTQHELPQYHDAIRRVLLELDPASSSHTAESYKVSLDCAAGGATSDRVDLHLLWAPPTDADTTSRLAAAQAECAAVQFDMGMQAVLKPRLPEQTACYEGTWEVIDRTTDPPTVRWSRQVGRCVDGPAGERDPYEVAWEMPDTANLSEVGVRFVGSLELTCDTLGAETWGTAHLMFGTWGGTMSHQVVLQPRMRWDCFPGWDP